MILIKLRDVSSTMIAALHDAGAYHHGDRVTLDIEVGDALVESADAIVSPANSFGFMDGGFDLALSRHFGWGLQDRVQAAIKAQAPFAELLVGAALCVPTDEAAIPHLIVAPTMRVPRVIVDPSVVFLATRAAVRCAIDNGFVSLILPGMGTGVGRLSHELAARQMIAGINEAVRAPPFPASWWAAHDRHFSREEPPR